MVRAPLARVNGDKRRDVLVSCWPPIDNVKPIWRPSPRLGLFAVFAARRRSGSGAGPERLREEYYTASVRSMSLGWHNFLYNSFDPAGFISVDKPPVALLIQVASVKLFGFHSPQRADPPGSGGRRRVALLYHLVQRRFGPAAGLLAALFLALTPVNVAIDRSSNTDSCLVLVLLLATWALTRAVEQGSRRAGEDGRGEADPLRDGRRRPFISRRLGADVAARPITSGPGEGADRGPGPLALERARRPPERHAPLRSATGSADRR